MRTYKIYFMSTKGLGREIPWRMDIECASATDAATVANRLADSLGCDVHAIKEEVQL